VAQSILWTVTDGARLLSVDRQTVKRWIKRGWLVAHRDHTGAWVFTYAALLDAQLVATLARQKRLGKLRTGVLDVTP
jgi:hypothetical protein